MVFALRVLLLAALFMTAHAAEPPTSSPLLGVFSNKAEGFYIKTLILDANGKGYYFVGVSGVPVLWKLGPTTNEIVVTGPSGANFQAESFSVRFDPAKREMTILDPQLDDGKQPLRHLTDEIPEEIRSAMKDFDGTIRGK